MKRSRNHAPSISKRLSAGAIAGIAAAATYAVEEEIDLRLFDYNADDLIMLGGLVTQNPRHVRPVGLIIHLINGAAAGSVYALIALDRIPGPPAVRGIIFALAENTSLYPLALFADHHPSVRNGSLDHYWNRTAFLQSVLRHVALGAVLGPLTARLLQR